MLVVQKYGGTSVASSNLIKKAAKRIVGTKRKGNSVVAVVSAPGHMTDSLMSMAHEITGSPAPREMDMLLSAGERISIALLCIAISEFGEPAVSFTGSQAGIITDSEHTKAKIVDIRSKRINEALQNGKITIVAGFQGVSTDNDITTLGRGGSDLTAVALAAALKADICEIYTDVEGIYTANPSIVKKARKIDKISYEEMLEMAACGALVLQTRAVEYARRNNVVLHVRSSFSETNGTIVDKKGGDMEKAIVSGISYDASEAKITILQVPDKPGIAATVFGALADANINVDMILQNVSKKGYTDISFTLPKKDLLTANNVIENVCKKISAKGYTCDETIAKVSLIGAGMKTHPGVAAKMFRVLADEKINIQMISTSTIKISCVVDSGDGEKATQVLHKAFELDKEKVIA